MLAQSYSTWEKNLFKGRHYRFDKHNIQLLMNYLNKICLQRRRHSRHKKPTWSSSRIDLRNNNFPYIYKCRWRFWKLSSPWDKRTIDLFIYNCSCRSHYFGNPESINYLGLYIYPGLTWKNHVDRQILFWCITNQIS